MKTIKARAVIHANRFDKEIGAHHYSYCIGATEQKIIDKENAHKAFVELLRVQYGEECDESMHMYIDDALKKAMEE